MRYLEDAFALVKEWEAGRLTDTAVRRTLPGLLRFAVEAAAKDRFFTRALTAGAAIADVDAAWASALTTRRRLTLAVFGEMRENHELDRWLIPPHRKQALKTAGSAVHQGLPQQVDPKEATRQVERLIQDLKAGAA